RSSTLTSIGRGLSSRSRDPRKLWKFPKDSAGEIRLDERLSLLGLARGALFEEKRNVVAFALVTDGACPPMIHFAVVGTALAADNRPLVLREVNIADGADQRLE